MRVTASDYYAGMLDIGENPDWERVARTIDLLRANDVRVYAVPSIKKESEGFYLPFFTKSIVPNYISMDANSNPNTDPRPVIEALSPYKMSAYAKIDPREAGAETLGAIASLSTEKDDGARTRVDELLPRIKPLTAGEAFSGLVGLDKQKDMLRKIGVLVGKHGRDVVDCLHMAFLGAPGTGKTELARRLLAYFDALGVTSGRGVFVKVAAGDLVGRYLGHTPGKVRRAVDRARGGLLFIDEAYALTAMHSYGQEAIDTLVETLEADRREVVCVIAGYTDQVDRMFEFNPGLRERFAYRVTFDDYTTDELVAIFREFARRRGFAVPVDVDRTVASCMAKMRGMADFANARTARRLFDRAIVETACRCDAKVLSSVDVERAFEQEDLGGAARKRAIGFIKP